MGSVRRFLRLPREERRLLMQALLVVLCVRVGLRLLPFPRLRRALYRLTPRPRARREPDPAVVQEVVSAVRRVSRHVPGAACLTQALAAQALLARRGVPALLGIGAALGELDQARAHAWVECGGRIALGGTPESVGAYATLARLEWGEP